MADSKITALTAISTVDPTADPLVIVDVSDTSMAASGTTKKSTINQLLGSGGTATLASATISGDLTVDTSTLKVDSANNAVGVGTASPTANTLTIGANRFIICSDSQSKFGDNGLINGAAADGNTQIQFFGSKSLFFNEGVATRMTLNSTGLGIGASPASYGGTFRTLAVNATDAGILDLMSNSVSQFRIFGNGSENRLGGITNVPLTFHTNNSEKMRIDSSGNVGIGVTPSAGGGCLQLKSGITFPATQVASSDANTLDDYEEGNWTPTVGDASSGGNQATTATAVGRYTKIGRLVTVQWEVTDINTTGLTAGNAVYIRGLPFASSSATTQFGTPAVSGVTFSGYLTVGVFNGSSFPIYSSSSGGSLADIKVSALASGTADILGTLTYIV